MPAQSVIQGSNLTKLEHTARISNEISTLRDRFLYNWPNISTRRVNVSWFDRTSINISRIVLDDDRFRLSRMIVARARTQRLWSRTRGRSCINYRRCRIPCAQKRFPTVYWHPGQKRYGHRDAIRYVYGKVSQSCRRVQWLFVKQPPRDN